MSSQRAYTFRTPSEAHWAQRISGGATVARLSQEGFKTTAREGDGYATTPQEASILGHLDVVETLLDNYANPNIYSGKIGEQIGTALQAACAVGHHDIVLLLLRYNADAYIQAGRHGTAIHIASTKGRDDIV
ncbi:Zinc finger RING-type [Penicillium samsonianum]|uniref:Zinc finger RING-type n=1 Tax=Penicillium samsonianum TaxID=1882272 RepID=UPI00254672DA|nr:Zinc finger RING-type [Penicillium samsonianum]KAJ6150538.1 Zinc finger RING-type [Penicillium samsonianum]